MSHTIKRLPKSEIELTINVSAEELEKHRQKALEELSHEVKVKGFRPGKVPPEVVKQHVDEHHIEMHTQELAIRRSYADAVVAEKLQVISRPQIKIESNDPFTYKATVAIMPEVEIKDYKAIKVPLKEVKVEDKDIEEVIAEFIKYGTTYEPIERAAEKGDRVEINFEGFDEKGTSVPHTKSANHPVIIGENTLIPGFEDELVGLKKDDKKEFHITFPADYHQEDFRKKKLKFKVEMKGVNAKKEPKFDEELIEKMTGKKEKVDDFRARVREDLQKRRETENRQKRENEYIEELIKRTKVEIPDSLIEEELDYIIEDIKEDLTRRGIQFETYLQSSKTTIEDMRKKYRPEAEKRIKARLALQHILQEEKIEVSADELTAELTKVKSFYPPEQAKKIDEDYAKGELKNQIANRLALRKLFEKVLAQ